jgi:hypothetical protein
MAIERLTGANIVTEILDIMGFDDSVVAPWDTDTRLIRKVNMVMHRVPQKIRQVAAQQGNRGRLGMPMWWTTINSTISAGAGNLVVTADTSTGSMPADMDFVSSIYDTTYNRFVDVIEGEPSQWYRDLRESGAGPHKAIHLQDHGQGAQRVFRFLPDVIGTPALRMEYFRLPTDFPNSDLSAEYPDGDYKYHYLWVIETVLDLIRVDDPSYDRYLQLEKEMLLEMADHARFS